MNVKNRIQFSLIAALFILILLPAIKTRATPDGISLESPVTCPSGGCAAGQRLNFRVDFSLSTEANFSPNTQICIYTEQENQEVSEGTPWADTTNAWFSQTGITSGFTYNADGENTFCATNATSSEALIFDLEATHADALSDALAFAFNIHSTATVGATIKAKIYQKDINGEWTTTPQILETFIPTTRIDEIAYVGLDPADCGNRTPCFVNSGDDLPDGIGTGLRDAISAVETDSILQILGDYRIKNHAVLMDKNLTISGLEDAKLSYAGTTCNEPMLSINAGLTIEGLIISDGECANPSRDLLQINSPDDITIKNNTLINGARGINVADNEGLVTVAFNHIAENESYAIYRASGTGLGQLKIYANNILDNNDGNQVDCNGRGEAHHNYWGSLDNNSWQNCEVDPGKALGAPILHTASKAGAEAVQITVGNAFTTHFDEKIGVRHTLGQDFDLIIVNHGQGQDSNIPFLQSGSGEIEACSNFYDIFLAENAQAENLIIRIKYDLSEACINVIESGNYCAHPDGDRAPIWWYDPAGGITDGWDLAGQNPQGENAAGLSGQEALCDAENDEITLVIDETGNPNNSDDLNFTPFVVGHQFKEGILLDEFTAFKNLSTVGLSWTTSFEAGIQGFYIQRSEAETGTYNRISDLIIATSDNEEPITYTFSDVNLDQNQAYFYKLEVVDLDGVTIATYGPFSTISSTPTASITPTLSASPSQTNTPFTSTTPFPTRTATRYIFRTLTPIPTLRNNTQGAPTQVRTYGRTPTQFSTESVIAIQQTDPNTGYPVPQEITPTPPDQMLGLGEESEDTSTAISFEDAELSENQDTNNNNDSDEISEPNQVATSGLERLQTVQWPYLILGIVSGLGLLGILSFLITRSRF